MKTYHSISFTSSRQWKRLKIPKMRERKGLRMVQPCERDTHVFSEGSKTHTSLKFPSCVKCIMKTYHSIPFHLQDSGTGI